VLAKLQKELPPVAFLQQRHIGLRPCGLSAYDLTRGNGKNNGYILVYSQNKMNKNEDLPTLNNITFS